jgi:UDP-N-acetylmuramate--alanine ligase
VIELHNIKNIYFIGIGGIGMSALARFFKMHGANVFGYDKTATSLTAELVNEGMHINYTDSIEALENNVDVIVYTPAIPSANTQLTWYIQNNYNVMKRSDMLQIISKAVNALCVAGTHGKTTVSTMLAHILRDTGFGCNAFLGGISVNYNSNYWLSENQVAVIEADEYDRSFLKLHPNTTIVTAMDADHLDIYGTEEEMQKSYLQFINSTEDILVYKLGIAKSLEFKVPKMYSYSLQNEAADFYASNIQMHNGTYSYTFCFRAQEMFDCRLNVGGMHNVENAIAATAVAYLQNIDLNKIVKAIANYKGVKRRFEYIIHTEKIIYIDDYAHHPEELNTLIKSAKALFPNKKCTIIFQPHLFTRTRDFVEGFAASLSMADEIILLDIYPARELPIEGITSEIISSRMSNTNVTILSMEATLEFVRQSKTELLITAGAGSIDTLINPIKNIIIQK